MKHLVLSVALITGAITLSGCATTGYSQGNSYAEPTRLASPVPIDGNSGTYMSPYTSDEVLAEWIDNAIKAKAGAAIGSSVGQAAGQMAAEEILSGFGIFGSLIGDKVGSKIGRDQALKSAGGMDFIRESSDLSFNKWEDLAVYMYVNFSENKDYADVLAATTTIYPELENYPSAIAKASRAVG